MAVRTTVHPRRTFHVGSVLAAGIAIDTRLTAEPTARARILKLSPAGSEVFRVGAGLVVRFPAPARLRADASFGAPLVRYGALLSSAPLEPDEQQALESFGEAVVLVAGGVAAALRLDEEAREDIAAWIDASEFAVADDVVALGGIASEPLAQLTPLATDLRHSLGMAPLDEKAAQVLAALRRDAPAQRARAGAGAWLRRFASGLINALRESFRKRPAAAAAKATPAPSGKRPSALARMRGALEQMLARALWSSKLAQLLGRQHAKYLARLLDMFDANDLDAALRHALPLGGEGGAGRLPLWTPSARADLSITPAQRPGASLGVGGDLFAVLRERYRKAFDRLAAMGEIEKAAFVLAELLNASEEAVLFLERHGRLRLAAEIAEARNLLPGLVVRQWFLAGDRARAIRIARRTNAFADAVVRLESSHKEEAKILRLIWADTLASSGHYAAAADIAWPVDEARNLAFGWIDRAIALGGPAGARMLARKARLRPEEFSDLLDRSLGLMRDDAEEARSLVLEFAHELVAYPMTDQTRILARASARRLLGDPAHKEGDRLVQLLLDASGDAAFQTDARASSLGKRPPFVQKSLYQRSPEVEIRRTAADRGATPVFDAAELPDGRMLVAVGELGAWLVSRDGKVITRFAEPASRIVISEQGDQAILLAQRGEVFRLSRVDLLGKRLRQWCDARFDRFAPDFDGLTWFVARGGALYAVDATAARWEHLWKVDEAGALVRGIRRGVTTMSAWFDWPAARPGRVGRSGEVWTYELPSLVLRRRQELASSDALITTTAIAADGDYAVWNSTDTRIMLRDGVRELPAMGAGRPEIPCLTPHWIVLLFRTEANAAIYLFDRGQLQVRARILLEGAGSHVGARIVGNRLLVFDAGGRVLALSLQSGALVREHRLA
jgi:hypothetical protein